MNSDSRKKGVIAISVGVFILFWILTNFIASFFITLVIGFLMNKLFKQKPELEKHWKVATAGLLVLAIAIPLVRAANNDAAMRAEKADIVSGQSETYAYITPADSYERTVETTIIDELGPSAVINRVEIVGSALNLEYVAQDNLTRNMTRQGILFDVKDIMERVSATIPENVTSVNFSVMLDLVDQHGNTELTQVARVRLDRDTWERINWDNFLVDNLPTVADHFWIHTALGQ